MTKAVGAGGWLKVAGAWLAAVVFMSLAFGVFVSVAKLIDGTFPDYAGANFFDEVAGWAMIGVFFIALASLAFALPAIGFARGLGKLTLLRTMLLGAVVGSAGALIAGFPMIDNGGGLGHFVLAGLTCGLVGAIVWWLLYERSISNPPSDA